MVFDTICFSQWFWKYSVVCSFDKPLLSFKKLDIYITIDKKLPQNKTKFQ